MQVAKTRGVVDVLADGYRVLNRHLWLLILPIVLDLFLWLGPEITAQSAATELVQRSPDVEGVSEVLSDVNLLGVVAWRFSSAVGVIRLDPEGALDLDSGGAVAAVTLAALVFGLMIFSVYYTLVASVISGPHGSKATLARRATTGFVRLALVWGVLIVIAFAVMTVVGLLTFGGPVGETLAGLLILLAGITAMFVWLLLYLVQPAIFVGGLGARAAVRQSAAVVRANFGAMLRLFVLIVLITFGTGIAWQGIVERGAGALIAIIGNAYVATGLAVAVPLFYLDRVRMPAPPAPNAAG